MLLLSTVVVALRTNHNPTSLFAKSTFMVCEASFIEAVFEELHDGGRHRLEQDLDILQVVHEVVDRVLLAEHSNLHETLAEAGALKV